ncbi:MAG: hypothetical protein JXA14_23335 [Anaerolineae bacterium]|nr:hypothetical protein [Anaerolineae bacterium]
MEKKIAAGLRYTFLVHAIAMTMFSVTFIFFPVQYGDLTGCLSNQVPQVYRLWGTVILGYAISSFLAYRATSWEKVEIVAQMECVITILFPIVMLLALLFWDFPAIGWMSFVVMVAFAIAFNWFYLEEKTEEEQR